MSSGSESDEEYVPKEPEQLSEEDSADDETNEQYEKELEHKTKKRKAAQETKGIKKRKTKKNITKTVLVEEKVEQPEQVTDPEEDKKREEDLWAKFLEGTDTKPKPTPKESNNIQPALVDLNNESKAQSKDEQQRHSVDKDREKRIFEFAGETIVVENNVIKEKIKPSENLAVATKSDGASSINRGSGGLSNILGQLNKKNKLSTLEKSKLDWDTYKKAEGIEEEVQSHNKGKAGYLDRQDFLERADHRQYEIERDLRMSRRSNR